MLKNTATAEQHYQRWNETGLKNIKPASIRYGENPEGWNVVDEVRRIVSPFIRKRILEIGCGYGRICRAFNPQQYIGVDINRQAIDKAKSLFPSHKFQHVQYVDQYPQADVIFAYTVFLHIPEENIHDLIQRLDNTAEDIIIAEAMGHLDQNTTQNYDHPDRFHAVYTRSSADYQRIVQQHGFYLFEETIKPYYYFDNTKLHFLHFKRLPTPPSTLKIPDALSDPLLVYSGIYEDGWVEPQFTVALTNEKKNATISIEGMLPHLPGQPTELNLTISDGENTLLNTLICTGEFSLTSKKSLPAGTYQLQISTNSNMKLPDPDNRPIGFFLKKIGIA